MVFYGKFWRQSIQRDRRAWLSMTHQRWLSASTADHYENDMVAEHCQHNHTTLLLSTKVIFMRTQYFGMFVCHLFVLEVVGGMREIVIHHNSCHHLQQRLKEQTSFVS